MKEIVFTKPPYMNASEQRIADMHSVLNILNILVAELSLVEPGAEEAVERYRKIDDQLSSAARQIKEGGDMGEFLGRIRNFESEVMEFMQSSINEEDDPTRRAELAESMGNLTSVYSILNKRLDELEIRADDPDVWIQIYPEDFKKQFQEAFLAIAKNSKGRYAIHFNLVQKEKGDYYIDLKVDTQPPGGALWMPLRLIDILRDLTANARKYSTPGGKVALAVYQDETCIQAVVEDHGCGIPDAEIEKVAEFGYRASNVRAKPTLGGGFGLTKAAWLVTTWGGSLTIRSELDRGTTIRLSVPNAERPDDPQVWSI